MSKITVIGAWNSGTHLIHNILANSDCINIQTGDKVDIYDVNRPIWKHNPKMAIVNDLIQDKKNIVIIMYRNIYNWIHSMLKDSYEVKMTSLDNIVKIENAKHGIDIYFKNIIHLYNHYYTNYKKFLEDNENVIIMDYNKIIDKNKAFDYINYKLSSLSIKITSYDKMLVELNKPAKNHGHPVKNSSQAQTQLETRKRHIITIIHKQYPKLLQYINHDLIDFYENDYHT